MKPPLFHLLLCDFDLGLAFVTDEVSDAASWVSKVDELRKEGKNITCQALPAVELLSHHQVVEKFCRQHGLTLTDKPFVRV